MTFSLKKTAYYYCRTEQRAWYNTVPKNVERIEILECCKLVFERRRNQIQLTYNRVHGAIEETMRNGHVDCLRALHIIWRNAINEPLEETMLCKIAAENDQLECLKYARASNFRWDVQTTMKAASAGSLECLRYARENGCPMDERVCCSAAMNGHLDCLRYVYEQGCPWDVWTTSGAALFGQIECLRFAHEHGCEWNETTTEMAAQGGHLDCLTYAHQNGCHWDELTIWAAECDDNEDCLHYALEHGCPRRPRTDD